jgi:5-methylcytosine-specific restriction protein B
MTGSPQKREVLSLEGAIDIARAQRDELVAGANVLDRFDAANASDADHEHLDQDMRAAAPTLYRWGWVHKYWFLNFPEKLDGYHWSPLQRYHLLKLLQLPPDNAGLLNAKASLFVCAGRFVQIARELSIPVATLCILLNQRNRGLHRYWRVGTTSGSTGQSQWPVSG